jgi:hypothetical protein
MPVSDYPGRAMLVAFYIQKQEAGTKSQRDQFSQELFDKFDAHIVAACSAATPPVELSARVRASIAVMAQNAPGGNNPAKARRAVQAYLTFRGF